MPSPVQRISLLFTPMQTKKAYKLEEGKKIHSPSITTPDTSIVPSSPRPVSNSRISAGDETSQSNSATNIMQDILQKEYPDWSHQNRLCGEEETRLLKSTRPSDHVSREMSRLTARNLMNDARRVRRRSLSPSSSLSTSIRSKHPRKSPSQRNLTKASVSALPQVRESPQTDARRTYASTKSDPIALASLSTFTSPQGQESDKDTTLDDGNHTESNESKCKEAAIHSRQLVESDLPRTLRIRNSMDASALRSVTRTNLKRSRTYTGEPRTALRCRDNIFEEQHVPAAGTVSMKSAEEKARAIKRARKMTQVQISIKFKHSVVTYCSFSVKPYPRISFTQPLLRLTR
jgi:hypothetical protein